jgi:hypothetical protein
MIYAMFTSSRCGQGQGQGQGQGPCRFNVTGRKSEFL